VVIFGFAQLAKMAEGPGYLVPVAFEIPVFLTIRPDYVRNLAGNTRLFGNTNFQIPA
jgi:hypothetical protein